MDTKIIQLAYGDGHIDVQLPESNLMGVFNPVKSEDKKPQGSEKDLIQQALKQPIGTQPLRQLVKKGDKVAIVTSDLTRPCPSERLIPPLLNELAAAGVPDEDIFIVLGLGLHRPMSEEEIDQALSPEIHQRIKVLNHDVQDTVRLGTTSRGTPVEFFRPVVEADFRICVGNLEFHWFAGFSGGAKAILPGCASKATVTANHAMMIEPKAAPGVIEGNPLRADIEEGVAMLGVDFILNAVVDREHKITNVVAGDVIAAHRKGCQLIAERGKVRVPEKADIVLASAGGFPKDINLYQSHKAMQNAFYFVKEGGIIILVAECREQMGNDLFEDWMFAASSPAEILTRIRGEFILGGHKAAALAAILDKVNVYLVSGLPAILTERLFMTPFAHPNDALKAALERSGENSRLLVLPEAVSTIPDLD